MNEFFARWKSESPKFFKHISAFGKYLIGVGAAVVAVTMAAPEEISHRVIEITQLVASYMIFGGGIIVAISNLPVVDYDALQQKIEEKKTNKQDEP